MINRVVAMLSAPLFLSCSGGVGDDVNKYSEPSKLSHEDMRELISKANSGDSYSQSRLSRYYREQGNAQKSQLWQRRCLERRFPACLADRAGELISDSTGRSVDEYTKQKNLKEAKDLVQEAIGKSSGVEKDRLIIMMKSILDMESE